MNESVPEPYLCDCQGELKLSSERQCEDCAPVLEAARCARDMIESLRRDLRKAQVKLSSQ